MKKKRYALILVLIHNLNITIYVIMIVLQAHIDFIKIEIYVLIDFQKIIILMKMIISIKNVFIDAKLVDNLEMKIIIIVMNVYQILHLLMIPLLFKVTAIIIAITIIILRL